MPDVARYYPLPVTMDGEPADQNDFLAKAPYTEEWEGIRIGVYQSQRRSELNFHGVVIKEPRIPDAAAIDAAWRVHADVRDCAALELTLSARKELVETEFTAHMRTACLHAI